MFHLFLLSSLSGNYSRSWILQYNFCILATLITFLNVELIVYLGVFIYEECHYGFQIIHHLNSIAVLHKLCNPCNDR